MLCNHHYTTLSTSVIFSLGSTQQLAISQMKSYQKEFKRYDSFHDSPFYGYGDLTSFNLSAHLKALLQGRFQAQGTSVEGAKNNFAVCGRGWIWFYGRKIHTYIHICHLSASELKFQRCFGIRQKQILLKTTFLEILEFLKAEVWEEGNRYLDGNFQPASCRSDFTTVPFLTPCILCSCKSKD